MNRYTDEYLEYWGRIFLERDLYARRGILFESFLLHPHEILAAVDTLPDDSLPLLPAQAEIMDRVARVDAERLEQALLPAHARLSERGYVEPMRHHAYDVSTARGLGSRPR